MPCGKIPMYENSNGSIYLHWVFSKLAVTWKDPHHVCICSGFVPNTCVRSQLLQLTQASSAKKYLRKNNALLFNPV